ncbi:aromatic ring-hydroxylating oxygenase subunit alpha [Marinobacterium aestuariivivens]|uniref:Aromatic ring-hydroxylating dioxygenase subunit alpha n=1 Tax=Marinobacterium aestuariivivens TaxID=1698799 RepID=A0ABW2A9B2_9GAMM
MSSKNRTLELISARAPRHALSRELYRDAEVYQQDLEQIWHREWVFVGHTFEIPKAGQYLTVQIGDYPVVIVRDDSGNVRAFHNACRHRGSRLCAEKQGKVAKLVCPYHRWTFGLDGKLLFAANMGEKFNNDDHGLLPVHCETVHSYVYVCVAEQAPDFEAFRQAVSPSSRRTTWRTARSPTSPTWSRKATGSWYSRTTASATTATATTRNC